MNEATPRRRLFDKYRDTDDVKKRIAELKADVIKDLPSLHNSQIVDKIAELDARSDFSPVEKLAGQMALLNEALYAQITPAEGKFISEKIGRIAINLGRIHGQMRDENLSASTHGMEKMLSNRRRLHEPLRFK